MGLIATIVVISVALTVCDGFSTIPSRSVSTHNVRGLFATATQVSFSILQLRKN